MAVIIQAEKCFGLCMYLRALTYASKGLMGESCQTTKKPSTNLLAALLVLCVSVQVLQI